MVVSLAFGTSGGLAVMVVTVLLLAYVFARAVLDVSRSVGIDVPLAVTRLAAPQDSAR
jgi:hypothetical protein